MSRGQLPAVSSSHHNPSASSNAGHLYTQHQHIPQASTSDLSWQPSYAAHPTSGGGGDSSTTTSTSTSSAFHLFPESFADLVQGHSQHQHYPQPSQQRQQRDGSEEDEDGGDENDETGSGSGHRSGRLGREEAQADTKRPLSVDFHNNNDANSSNMEIQGGDNGSSNSNSKKPRLTRIQQACISCGVKKQKCTGGHPCNACKNAGSECTYRESKKRGPPKGTKRAPKKLNLESGAAGATVANTSSSTADGDAKHSKAADSSRERATASMDSGRSRGEEHNQLGPQQQQQQQNQGTSVASSTTAGTASPSFALHPPPLPEVPGMRFQQQHQHTSHPHHHSLPASANGQSAHHHHHHQMAQFGLGSSTPHSGYVPLSLQQQPSSSSAASSYLNTAGSNPSGSHLMHSRPLPSPPALSASSQTSSLPAYNFGYPHMAPHASASSGEGHRRTTASGVDGAGIAPTTYGNASNAHLHAPPPGSAGGGSTSVPPDVSVASSDHLGTFDLPEHENVIVGVDDVSEGRMLLFQTSAKDHHGGELDGKNGSSAWPGGPHDLDDVTEHYRGASSGIPSLHARRHHSSDEGYPDLSRRTRSFSTSSINRSNNHHHTGGNGGLHAPTSPGYGDARMREHEAAGGLREPGYLDDEDAEAFTLPPIRMVSSRPQGGGGPKAQVHVPKGLFDRLISYYFSISHHSCPIIYKPDIDIPNIQDQLPQLLLDGMCCLAARFLENDDLTSYLPHLRGAPSSRMKLAREQIEQHYYDRARKQIQDDDYRSDIPTVQALLLLSKRDTGCGRMLHCWQLVGSATRMVIDLGMHRKSAMMLRAKDTTYGQIETRRRVFWQAYIMDKHTAASLGRPVFLREEDIDVLLPSEVAPDEFERWVGRYPSNASPPENRAISTHNAFARLTIVLQSIIHDVYSMRARKQHFQTSPITGEYMCYAILRELYSQLCAWKSSLPTHLQWSPTSSAPPPPPHQLLLHAFYETCMLLLFRPVVPVSKQVAFEDKHGVPRPYDVCTQAADAIMQIMAVYELSYGLKRVGSSTAVYYIFTAATIYVGNSSSLSPEVAQEAKTGLRKCTDLLEHLSETCLTASQHRQILLDISHLSSTKLKSRGDAENLLSSRVPAQNTGQQQQTEQKAEKLSSPVHPGASANMLAGPQGQSQKLEFSPAGSNTALSGGGVAHEQPGQPSISPNATKDSLNGILDPTPSLAPSVLPSSNASTNTAMPPSQFQPFPFPSVPAGQVGFGAPASTLFGNPYLGQPTQASAFAANNSWNGSNGFESSFNFAGDNIQMPFTTNASANADLAFWREMPIGEDPNQWGFFTDQYANTLLSSLPSFTDPYSTQP